MEEIAEFEIVGADTPDRLLPRGTVVVPFAPRPVAVALHLEGRPIGLVVHLPDDASEGRRSFFVTPDEVQPRNPAASALLARLAAATFVCGVDCGGWQ